MIIGGLVGITLGITLGVLIYYSFYKLYNYLNKVEIVYRTVNKNWIVYHVNEGPSKIRKFYWRDFYLDVEGAYFYKENGSSVSLRKWALLNTAVNKFKIENDLL